MRAVCHFTSQKRPVDDLVIAIAYRFQFDHNIQHFALELQLLSHILRLYSLFYF